MFKQLVAASCLLITSATALAADANIIYLTRHAEKQTAGSDPALTEAGQLRAQNIADLLKRANISSIYSTDYNRTKQTAQPLSAAISVPVTLYDPSQLPSLASQLNNLTGNTLVVGHSNTTPELVGFLGGEATAISESEFDRLYQVIIGDNGQVTTVLLTSLPAQVTPANCHAVQVNASGLSASKNAWVYDTIEVPDCASTLTVDINGNNGDADLYIRSGSQPTSALYECRPWIGGSNETCTVNNPGAGTWHIGINAYDTFSGVSLTATAAE
ncbi:MAG: pre-peptidase C-terminal domain-containing protein [Algicola sp.]|nr:pre-peptidase C-terminal domain-containing protein [Algicola sp.]